jgi:hypothetical protein
VIGAGRGLGWASKKRPGVRLQTAGLYYINVASNSSVEWKVTKSLSGIASAPNATALDLEPCCAHGGSLLWPSPLPPPTSDTGRYGPTPDWLLVVVHCMLPSGMPGEQRARGRQRAWAPLCRWGERNPGGAGGRDREGSIRINSSRRIEYISSYTPLLLPPRKRRAYPLIRPSFCPLESGSANS